MIKKDPTKKVSTLTTPPVGDIATSEEGRADKLEEAQESAEYEKHEIEGAADCLMQAEEIKAKPKLHGHAMDHMKMKHETMGKAMSGGKPRDLAELRKIASKKSAE